MHDLQQLQQRVLERSLPDDLTTLPMERLRAARADLSQAEADVSYVRRVVQGRVDIVGHEVQRRAGSDHGPAASTAVVFDLPDILSVGGSTSVGQRRAATFPEPGALANELATGVDAIVSSDELANLDGHTRDQVAELRQRLEQFEAELSTLRRELHARIDRIQNELGRRYGEGEASVDSLLEKP